MTKQKASGQQRQRDYSAGVDLKGGQLTERAESDLESNCLWEVPLRMGQLLSHVCNSVGRANGESTVEDAEQES